MKEIKKTFPKATWSEYTPIDETASEQAASAVFGQALRVLPDYASAHRIVSLDADFLASGEGHLSSMRGFAKTRRSRIQKMPTR